MKGVRQHDERDCGIACIATICLKKGIKLPMLQESAVAFERLDDILEYENEDIQNVNSTFGEEEKTKLVLKDVAFRYGYSDNILRNISLELQEGCNVHIVGKSGSGKSTLVKLMSRLQDSTKGEILFNGIDIKNYDIHTLRKKIIYTSQNGSLFCGTILENITIGVESYDYNELLEIVDVCGINDILSRRNWGLNNVISENGRNLSGGERQRIIIARSLLRKGKIYIFDESTNQVDKKLERQIVMYIKEKLKKAICIFIMHNVDYLKEADWIIVIDRGHIVGQGKHSELINSNAIYQNLILIE